MTVPTVTVATPVATVLSMLVVTVDPEAVRVAYSLGTMISEVTVTAPTVTVEATTLDPELELLIDATS